MTDHIAMHDLATQVVASVLNRPGVFTDAETAFVLAALRVAMADCVEAPTPRAV